ncbi:MAG: transketolase C-terminal domain-containing protein, partial [Ignavibacteriota bacterium]
LDKEAIYESVRKTNRILILHEDNLTAGFGAELSALITEFAFESLDAPIRRLASFDSPVPFAPTLEREVLPSKKDLVAAIDALLKY